MNPCLPNKQHTWMHSHGKQLRLPIVLNVSLNSSLTRFHKWRTMENNLTHRIQKSSKYLHLWVRQYQKWIFCVHFELTHAWVQSDHQEPRWGPKNGRGIWKKVPFWFCNVKKSTACGNSFCLCFISFPYTISTLPHYQMHIWWFIETQQNMCVA